MPYKLRKAPKKDLYWVVNKESGKKYSKEALPKGRAEAQMRALYANETKGGKSYPKPQKTIQEGPFYTDSLGNQWSEVQYNGVINAIQNGVEQNGWGIIAIENYLNGLYQEGHPVDHPIPPMVREESIDYENTMPIVIHDWKNLLDSDLLFEAWANDQPEPDDLASSHHSDDGYDEDDEDDDDHDDHQSTTSASGQVGAGKKGGGPTPTKGVLQQLAVASYEANPPATIGSFKLVKHTPTLKFYYDEAKNFMVVAIRGTKLTDKHDLIADALAVTGNLRNSYRYKNDAQQVREMDRQYPKARFFGVGHSLGGAILDLFLRNRLIDAGMSYNGFPEPHERQGNPLHHRIYHTGDFIYKMFASKIPNIELRTTSEPFWKYLVKYSMPIDLFTGIDRHMLGRFKGGLLL